MEHAFSIHKFRQGDGDQFAYIYKKHYLPCVYFLMKRFPYQDRAILEDVVSWVMLRAYEIKETFSDYGHVCRFVFKSARLKAINAIRYKERQYEVHGRFIEVIQAVEQRSLEDELELEAQSIILRRNISALPHNAKVVLGYFLKDLTNEEIALIMGKEVKFVKDWKSKAFQILKELQVMAEVGDLHEQLRRRSRGEAPDGREKILKIGAVACLRRLVQEEQSKRSDYATEMGKRRFAQIIATLPAEMRSVYDKMMDGINLKSIAQMTGRTLCNVSKDRGKIIGRLEAAIDFSKEPNPMLKLLNPQKVENERKFRKFMEIIQGGEQLSNTELAERCGISIKTVRQYLKRPETQKIMKGMLTVWLTMICMISLPACGPSDSSVVHYDRGWVVQDYYSKGIHYLIFTHYRGGIFVQNYTQDSIELDFNTKYGDYDTLRKTNDLKQDETGRYFDYVRDWQKHGTFDYVRTNPCSSTHPMGEVQEGRYCILQGKPAVLYSPCAGYQYCRWGPDR